MRIVVQTDIEAPREAVWDYIVGRDQTFDFIVGLTRWAPEGPKRGGLGARYLMGMRVGSVELGGVVEIVEFDPPCDMAWSGVTGVEQRGRWRLRARAGGGTRVELRLTYHAPGGLMGTIADLVASWIVERDLRLSLAELKRRLEKRERARSRPVAARSTVGARGHRRKNARA